MKFSIALVPALILASGVAAQPFEKRADKCNGYSSLCNKKYSNVTYVGTHNSYAHGSEGSPGVNQNVPVTKQLEDGVRLLQIQGQEKDSGVSLCHTSCLIHDGGTLESYAKDVVKWLESNRNEVITIIISNPSDIPVSKWAQSFKSSGLDKYAYTSQKNLTERHQWPTLKQMINDNHRVVIFMDRQTNIKHTNFILPEFSNVWETPYDQRSLPFNCTPDRYATKPSKLMYLHNNVLDKEQSVLGKKFGVPDTDKLGHTNSYKVVRDSVNSCAKKNDHYPTFILVDYYDVGGGGPFKAAAEMNGVHYHEKKLGGNDPESRSAAAITLPHLAHTSIVFAAVLVLYTMCI
mgnify:CR=1 FL=1